VSLAIEFPACLEADFANEVPLARQAVEQGIALGLQLLQLGPGRSCARGRLRCAGFAGGQLVIYFERGAAIIYFAVRNLVDDGEIFGGSSGWGIWLTIAAGVLVDPTDVEALSVALARAAALPRPNPAGVAVAAAHDVRVQASKLEEILAGAAPGRAPA